MKTSLVLGAGRGPRLAVLEGIKRSGGGLSVKELSRSLGMSYMGVKAHCVALEGAGYLSTWRRPGPGGRGRPTLLYRLSEQGEDLFAESGEELALALLREAAGLFGTTAPQKLLLMVFRAREARYRGQLGELAGAERIRAFVRMREREGRMAVLEGESPWRIRENHDPLAPILREYPAAAALEEHLVSEVLGIPVARSEQEGAVVFVPRR